MMNLVYLNLAALELISQDLCYVSGFFANEKPVQSLTVALRPRTRQAKRCIY